jgi:uncharacterized protein YndB with AHSA1/START domain
MATLESSIVINRPIEEVFRAVIDFEQHPQWREGLLKAEITSPEPVQAGTTYVYNMRVMGRKIETTGEVVAYDPPTLYAWKATSGPFPLSGRVRCETVAEGTRVTETVEAEPGGFFKLAEPLLMRQQQSRLEKDLKALKAMLESEAASSD